MPVEANSEFRLIEFKGEYKCESCDTVKYEILELKNNLLILTKIDNAILQKLMNQIESTK